jgi:hypothetical protein
LVKSEVSDGGEGWNDSKIAEALDTSVPTVERTRRQIVGPVPQVQSEIGSVRISMARRRLIALKCGPTPEGHAKWLAPAGTEVVELPRAQKSSSSRISKQ